METPARRDVPGLAEKCVGTTPARVRAVRLTHHDLPLLERDSDSMGPRRFQCTARTAEQRAPNRVLRWFGFRPERAPDEGRVGRRGRNANRTQAAQVGPRDRLRTPASLVRTRAATTASAILRLGGLAHRDEPRTHPAPGGESQDLRRMRGPPRTTTSIRSETSPWVTREARTRARERNRTRRR